MVAANFAWAASSSRSKSTAIYLTTTLLLTPTFLLFGDSASDELKLRYGNSSGKATLSVHQDISTVEHDMKARRNFLLNLELDERTHRDGNRSAQWPHHH